MVTGKALELPHADGLAVAKFKAYKNSALHLLCLAMCRDYLKFKMNRCNKLMNFRSFVHPSQKNANFLPDDLISQAHEGEALQCECAADVLALCKEIFTLIAWRCHTRWAVLALSGHEPKTSGNFIKFPWQTWRSAKFCKTIIFVPFHSKKSTNIHVRLATHAFFWGKVQTKP